MEDILFYVAEALTVAVFIAIILKQAKLIRHTAALESEAMVHEADIAELRHQVLHLNGLISKVKKPAARKAAVNKEAK